MRNDEQHARWKRLLELLEPHHQQAGATARRLCRNRSEGDDLFQEAVLRAFEKLHTLRDEERFRAWFFAVLFSIHRSRSRRGFWRRFLALEEEVASGREPAGEDGAAWEERRRQAERASRALAILPAVQREAVVLFELEGFSIEEIAEMQRVSTSAVKSRLARGRGRLRRHYERSGIVGESAGRVVASGSALPHQRFAPCASRGGPLSEGGTQ